MKRAPLLYRMMQRCNKTCALRSILLPRCGFLVEGSGSAFPQCGQVALAVPSRQHVVQRVSRSFAMRNAIVVLT